MIGACQPVEMDASSYGGAAGGGMSSGFARYEEEQEQPPVIWRPTYAQAKFLASGAFEVGFGGAAGGGKSDSVLIAAIRDVDHPAHHAVIFRRTFPDLERSIIPRSKEIYPFLGGEFNESKKLWTFPSGSTVRFAHLSDVGSELSHKSAAYTFVGFDEATSFLAPQYVYLLSRLRSADGLRCVIRSATNPGDVGHEWYLERFSAWLDPKHPNPARDGEIRWYVRDGEKEREVPRGTKWARSRTFFRSRLSDNPYLASDGEYEANLRSLDPITRAQLLDGDWLIRPDSGKVFNRSWFEIVSPDSVPKKLRRVRYWDRAATEPSPQNPDPDWTVGLLVGVDDATRTFYVLDMVRFRHRPARQQELIRQTAESDGKEVEQVFEQDPGSAGVSEVHTLLEMLKHLRADSVRPSGSKEIRARNASAQSERKAVKIVQGSWDIEAFLKETHDFPKARHDDIVDTLSGAINRLSETKEEDPIEFYRSCFG